MPDSSPPSPPFIPKSAARTADQADDLGHEELWGMVTVETVSAGDEDTSSPKRRERQSTAAQAVSAKLTVTAIILVALSLRPGTISVGPILSSIIAEFRLSHTVASLLTSIPDVLMGVLALPTPWLARRFGRDSVLLTALVLLSLSIALRAFSTGTAGLLVTTAGIGAGIAVAGTLIAGFIKARFPTQAAMLMGVYAAALSLGSTLSAGGTGPIAQHVASGWRLALGMWSVLGITAITGWLTVALSERRHRRTVPVVTSSARLPLSNKTAWLVALFFACSNFLFYSLVAWTSAIYQEAGLSAAISGLILASFTAGFMIGNPIFGWLSKSEDRRGWLTLCAVLVAAGLVPPAINPTLAPFVFIPLCAFGLGGTFPLGMTLPLDNTHSVEEADVWNAFVLTVGYLVAAAGPLLVGFLRDVDGSFRSALWLLVAVAAAMLSLTPFLQPHHHPRKAIARLRHEQQLPGPASAAAE